ncbi:MAG TPA: hypothetical protein VK641_01100 [Terriglobales bacterium]|nr:hypothetical protein [Terriglobales bacterium]
MASLLVVLVMILTAGLVVGIGIFAAYGAVLGILHAFAYQTRQRSDRALVLVPRHSVASGD